MIRLACPEDLPGIMSIYESARAFMRESGNRNQWTGGYPQESLLADDIEKGHLFVCEDEGKVYAVFACIVGEDPTYLQIDGEWISDSLYCTIHRSASDGTHKRVFKECSDFAYALTGHVRVDTHEDNKVMQQAVLREGYKYCGVIRLENGDPRLAYELL